MDYREFLETKVETAPVSGFEIDAEELNPALKPHQRDAVLWALRGGRRAIFASFGLGKSSIQIEFCHQCLKKCGGKALIVLPLGVRQEFKHDAVELLGYNAPEYITEQAQAAKDGTIYMTNYERVRDGDIDPKAFAVVSLDEAAVLRSYGSKTYQTFLPKFQGVRYKMVATATPAPNRLKELIHYAGFLEILDTGFSLTRFFQRDSTKANNLTLYPHKVEEFWLWVSTWALYITKPSDLGYDDTGYVLPEMEVRTHVIPDQYGENADKDGQYKLTNDAATSLQDASREKNQTVLARCKKAKEIVESDPDAHFILWHDLENERRTLRKLMPDVVDIYGTMSYDERERRVNDFAFGKTRLFATKKSLSGVGCNFQRYCHREIFVGIDYQFHNFIQACHRIYRFLQTERVIIDVIYTESEEPIYNALMEKWRLHDEQQERMREIIKKHGLSGDARLERLKRDMGVKRVEVTGERFRAVNEDCVIETSRMGDSSVDMILTSIPFCYDSDTEVLTEGGWMKFSALNSEIRIATYNADTNRVELQHSTRIVDEDYEGWMIEFESKLSRLCVTPNHRMYVKRSGCSEYEILTADELYRDFDMGYEIMSITKDSIESRFLTSCTKKMYSGRIGCVSVPNGLIVVMRNGYPCICGNSNHYEYTPNYSDFGHNENTEKFFDQMNYLTPNLLRVLKPGRVLCVHVKDRILFGNATGTGMPTVEPFHAICIQHYMAHGFQYFGMITIVTDVVRENNQTYRLGWTEQCKDGSKMGVGCPEYVLLFRKLPTDTSTAYADEPVIKTKEEYTRAQWQLDAHGFWRDSGDRLLTKDELSKLPVDRLQAAYRKYSRQTVYNYEEHMAMCKKLDEDGHLPATFMVMAPGSWRSDVWDDINRMKTLNTEQKRKDLQLHVCPLQKETVSRLINRFSNKGDLIFDPFGGIGTVPYMAIKMGRHGAMTELNPGYFRDAVGYLHAAEEEIDVPSLFDFMDAG